MSPSGLRAAVGSWWLRFSFSKPVDVCLHPVILTFLLDVREQDTGVTEKH